jgi:hypothetical protein
MDAIGMHQAIKAAVICVLEKKYKVEYHYPSL